MSAASTKVVASGLEQHEELIHAFWKVKKGSKGEIAWKLLMTELGKLRSGYGDAVVAQQLQLAINGKWNGITAANYVRFATTPGKNAPPPPKRRKTPEEIEAEAVAAHQQRLREMGLV